MEPGTQTIATFTGTLLRREHAVGQKFVQLIFREDDRNWLCVSSKLQNASLQIGQNYRVEGVFREVGGREFIQDPQISPAKARPGGRTSRKRLLFAGIAGTVLLGIGGVAFALHSASGHSLQAANTASTTLLEQGADDTTAKPASVQTTANDSAATLPSATAPPTAAATAPKSARTVTPATPGQTNNVVQPVQQPVSTAYCDAPVTIPVTYVDTVDDSVPPGTESGGTPGQSQTCYDDASGSNPTTKIVVTMIQGTRAIASNP